MNAEIVSIGTELLLGEIVDSNAAFIAQELAELGIPVYWISQVGDNPARLEDALRRALDRSTVVITTGGLGPTGDDLTREAISAIVRETPEVDSGLEQTLRERFKSMGRPMPQKNLKQAWLIPSAESLTNPLGTAPGWWVQVQDGKHVACMPGPPSEMRSMWTDCVRPRLEHMADASFVSVSLKTFGAGESAVEERLGDLVKSGNPSVATYAKRDGVYVRIAASGATKDEAQALMGPAVKKAKEVLGPDVFGSENDSLASIVGVLLQKRDATVATAESVTGGLVASYLTDVRGSSQHVLGGVVAYNEDIKKRFGVDEKVLEHHGVVSEATALALADAARETFRADFGIGTTGAAGPEPHGGKDPGVAFVAVSDGVHSQAMEVRRIAPREAIKHYVALNALDLLRRMLLEPADNHEEDPSR